MLAASQRRRRGEAALRGPQAERWSRTHHHFEMVAKDSLAEIAQTMACAISSHVPQSVLLDPDPFPDALP